MEIDEFCTRNSSILSGMDERHMISSTSQERREKHVSLQCRSDALRLVSERLLVLAGFLTGGASWML